MTEDWFSEEMATFGDRLAAAREAGELTQAVLARRIGVSERLVRDWENDVKEPRANRLATIAGILGISVGWLLTGEGQGVSTPEAELPAGVAELLAEIRATQARLVRETASLARLEKQLRSALTTGETA